MADYTCPYCRKKFPASMLEGAEADLQKAYAEIPLDVSEYVGLFQPEGKRMMSKKELRLVKEIGALIRTGHVCYKTEVPRVSDVSVWRQAIDTMLTRKLKLPMKNHNYLCAIAWEIADEKYRKGYAERVKAENRGARGAALPPKPEEAAEPMGGMTPEELRAVRIANAEKAKRRKNGRTD